MLRDERPDDALNHFRAAAELEKQNPYYLSFLGVSVARSQRKWDHALTLCEMAVQTKHNEPQLYLNLAEVYMLAGRKEEALLTLDRAQSKFGGDGRIVQARKKLGCRRAPVLPFLDRQHALNRSLGILRSRMTRWKITPRSRARSDWKVQSQRS